MTKIFSSRWVWAAAVFSVGTAVIAINPLVNESVAIDELADVRIFNADNAAGGGVVQKINHQAFLVHPSEKRVTRIEFHFNRATTLRISGEFSSGPNQQCVEKDTSKRLQDIYVNGLAKHESVVPYEVTLKLDEHDDLDLYFASVGNSECQWSIVRTLPVASTERLQQWAVVLVWSAIILLCFSKARHLLGLASFLAFCVFLLAEIWNFGAMSFSAASAYTCLEVGISCLVVLVLQASKKPPTAIRWAIFCLLSILYLVPISFFVYAIVVQGTMSVSSLHSLFQTNYPEAMGYLREVIGIGWVLAGSFAAILIAYLKVRPVDAQSETIDRLFLSALALLCFSATWAQSEEMRTFKMVRASVESYFEELRSFQKAQNQRAVDPGLTSAVTKHEQNETYLLIIGESLNKLNMGVYGYVRDTTPRLDDLKSNGEVFLFEQAYATHPYSSEALTLALTSANQLNGLPFFSQPSVVNIANAAGFETFWVSNQVMMGNWDNLVSVLAGASTQVVPLNSAIGMKVDSEFDEIVIPVVRRVLSEKAAGNRLIVVHLMGSHMPYCDRFPHNFDRFQGELSIHEFGALARKSRLADSLNCYDNSIRYNDHVIAELVNAIKEVGGVSAMLYFADHADDVFGQAAHNADRYNYSMSAIPLIVWLSDAYKNRYPLKAQNIASNLDKVFPNDLVFETMLGLMNMQWKSAQSTFDLTDAKFGLHDDQLMVVDGSRRFVGPQNWRLIQSRNITQLNSDEAIANRVMAHRVNTTGKASQVFHDGLDAIEVDVLYRSSPTPHFEVGHDDQFKTGLDLRSFLDKSSHQVGRIWLDIKNLERSNLTAALSLLEALDQRFGLRQKTIVESSIRESEFSSISKSGFHTSYYLPTEEIDGALQAGNPDHLGAVAKRIASQITAQDVEAISFDWEIHPFVFGYLEHLLADEIVYHIWDLRLRLSLPDLAAIMYKRGYVQNLRVRTILLGYQSEFEW